MRDLTAPYVLHALPAGERAAFEQHLRDCPACRREVGELGGTIAQLAAAWSRPPSPDLRARVLARVRDTPQQPPAAEPPDHSSMPVRTRFRNPGSG
ncbi:zf-HC2 domain-containing protein [Nocardia blacklockiae]|uniref:zf-HC2 domain-containing protein n=1 Tax=Nocardia blacklockiae TaxID=480036 RepID=UPI001895F970|nr:zf-HC2 domain-containing protein [Nocardia blacklockiae]